MLGVVVGVGSREMWPQRVVAFVFGVVSASVGVGVLEDEDDDEVDDVTIQKSSFDPSSCRCCQVARVTGS